MKPVLILAGAGAGKTSWLISDISNRIKQLHHHKFLVVITYTNAATNEINERLMKAGLSKENVFVGTIHSFLVRFVIKPYAHIHSFVPNEISYVPGEIESTKSGAEKNIEEAVVKKSLRKKGILTFNGIVDLAHEIVSEKANVREMLANRIQYLYVDEFQDTTKKQFDIFDFIRKQKRTQICYVGDPEQTIMRFQQKGKRTNINNLPINICQKGKIHDVVHQNTNYRSSGKIISFINNFQPSRPQVKSNNKIKTEHNVMFITKSKLDLILADYDIVCHKAGIVGESQKGGTRFFLSKERRLFENFENRFISELPSVKGSSIGNTLNLVSEIVTYCTGRSRENVISTLNIDPIMYRQHCMNIVKRFAEKDFSMDVSIIKSVVNTVFGVSVLSLPQNAASLTNPIEKEIVKKLSILRSLLGSNDSQVSQHAKDFQLTIHSSKGLEADSVLVVARNKKELLKWIEVDVTNRLQDKNDDCRLGYVAFSRAKELLCIACLEDLDTSIREKLCLLGVDIV